MRRRLLLKRGAYQLGYAGMPVTNIVLYTNLITGKHFCSNAESRIYTNG